AGLVSRLFFIPMKKSATSRTSNSNPETQSLYVHEQGTQGVETGCLYPPAEVARLQEFIERRESHGRAQYEFYIPQTDGGRLPVAVTSRLVHGGDGRRYGIITATDITDQKRVQEGLRDKNALLLGR